MTKYEKINTLWKRDTERKMMIMPFHYFKRYKFDGKELVIKLDCFGAMNTDLAHWVMAAIEMWNNRMKQSPMKCTHFETDGMNKPVYNEEDMRKFYDEWKDKLPYDWGNKNGV